MRPGQSGSKPAFLDQAAEAYLSKCQAPAQCANPGCRILGITAGGCTRRYEPRDGNAMFGYGNLFATLNPGDQRRSVSPGLGEPDLLGFVLHTISLEPGFNRVQEVLRRDSRNEGNAGIGPERTV